MVIKKNLLNKENEKILTEIYEPDNCKETIVFCHGITGCRKGRTMSDDYLQVLAQKLCDLNYRVILFDFSGHGESEGRDLDVSLNKSTSELELVVNEIEDKNNISFLAFSYGAAVLCNFLKNNKNIKPRKIVLYSPCIFPLESCFLNKDSIFGKDIVKEFDNGNLKKNGYATVGAKNFKFGYKMIEECENFTPDYYLNFSKNILVLTGKNDVILNTKLNSDFCKKYSIKEEYLEASHSLFENIDLAYKYTIDFFEK